MVFTTLLVIEQNISPYVCVCVYLSHEYLPFNIFVCVTSKLFEQANILQIIARITLDYSFFLLRTSYVNSILTCSEGGHDMMMAWRTKHSYVLRFYVLVVSVVTLLYDHHAPTPAVIIVSCCHFVLSIYAYS